MERRRGGTGKGKCRALVATIALEEPGEVTIGVVVEAIGEENLARLRAMGITIK
tara:strand:- start:259 stop:420 length:162 start_codon:yes stop_codon:yes gene_type:complete